MRNMILSLSIFAAFPLTVVAQVGPSVLPRQPNDRPRTTAHIVAPKRSADVDHGPLHARGEPDAFVPVDLDDAIPRPTAATFRSTPECDVQTAPASGDPFFLGFAAQSYYPPAGEKVDPLLLAALRSDYADGRPAQETYAFVMFEKRITSARVAELEALGVRVLQFHPYYTLKVALPPREVERVAALDFVHWIGVARPQQKVHPLLTDVLCDPKQLGPDGFVDVYVDVFDSDLCADSQEFALARPWIDGGAAGVEEQLDGHAATKWMSHGWQERAIAGLGLQVTEYIDGIRAFRARLHPTSLAALVALDFVQFVEFDGPVAPLSAAPAPHEESMPLIGADVTRAQFDGAATYTVVAGLIDSGLDTAHNDLNPTVVGWDLTGANAPFNDPCEHGSHVAGTILGDGTTRASLRGVAPGLGWGTAGRFYSVKIFGGTCSSSISLATMMNLMHTPYFDGTTTSGIPQVINNSWGYQPAALTSFYGTEYNARLIDDESYNYAQLYVFAMGNGGPTVRRMSLEAASKNAFSVGSVVDHPTVAYGDPSDVYDDINNGSSIGPTGDGRWKPNVCAPGYKITSVDANSTNGYKTIFGTSMATPHVTGLAAQLLDHTNWIQGWPEVTKALLMATATTKDDVLLATAADTHLNQFGTGRVEAYRAHWTSAQIATYVWAYSLGNSSTYVEFPISAGATRIVACMHYSEPAASAGGTQALVNNFDMYIDRPPVDTVNNNTGEYTAQQSLKDNTEIRMIDASLYGAGTWRLKVYPTSVTGNVYIGVVVQIIYGDTTPDGTLSVTANDTFVQPNQDVTISATVTNPSFVASAVVLDSTSTGDTLQSASTTLDDGPLTTLTGNESAGRDITLGDIRHGTQRSATWVTRWPSEGVQNWSVAARSDNWIDETAAVNVTVDGTPPGAVTGLTSTSHTVNVWSNNPNINFAWSPATDTLAGIDGYAFNWGNNASIPPPNAKNVEESSLSYLLPVGNAFAYYFAVRSVDNCGNWDPNYVVTGPYKVDSLAPTMPGNISSTTHHAYVQNCATSVTMNWLAASDSISGLAGYCGVWDTNAGTVPAGALNIAAGATSYSVDIGSSTSARYFHLRARDNAGNWSNATHFGAVYANANSISSYCTSKLNSLGCMPTVHWTGQPDKSAGTFTVSCSAVLNNQYGLVIWSRSQIATPFQGGWLCVGSPLVRGPLLSSGGAPSGSSCTGSYTHVFTTSYMNAWAINAGDTIAAQFWMRDPPIASTTGLSNALRFTVCE